MKKKWITLLAVLGSLAMCGIILVQLLWIRNALRVSQEQFDRSVSEALNKVAGKLEKKEDIVFINQRLNLKLDTLFEELENREEYEKRKPSPENFPLDSISLLDPLESHFSIRIDSILSANLSFTQDLFYSNPPFPPDLINLDSIRTWTSRISITIPPGKPQPPLPPALIRHSRTPGQVRERKAGQSFRQEWEQKQQETDQLQHEVSHLNAKVRKMKDVVKQMVIEVETKDRNVENRIDPVNLKEEMDKTFGDAGLRLPYEYAIVHPDTDSLTAVHSLNFTSDNTSVEYRTRLFPSELFSESSQLVVYFPNQQRHILKSLSVLMGASLIFTLALMFTFLATIITIVRQKKISAIKTDFINNMTHEFKTPIATISLAADSINNPRVINDPEKIQNYTRVIREENHRMNAHVEQVLQMALLDRGQIRLDKQRIDVHEMLSRAVENILLQVDAKQGTVIIDFQAEQPYAEADEIHLFNAVLNLLDNANKYSGGQPEIKVSTSNQADWLVIGVEDKGEGMNKETQKKIFEKFYRVHTGNIHNIKGFGLGLSYVKAIVEAHHGKIAVFSEPGKGSRFEIRLPLL